MIWEREILCTCFFHSLKKFQKRYCKLIVLFSFKYLVLTSIFGFPCRNII